MGTINHQSVIMQIINKTPGRIIEILFSNLDFTWIKWHSKCIRTGTLKNLLIRHN